MDFEISFLKVSACYWNSLHSKIYIDPLICRLNKLKISKHIKSTLRFVTTHSHRYITPCWQPQVDIRIEYLFTLGILFRAIHRVGYSVNRLVLQLFTSRILVIIPDPHLAKVLTLKSLESFPPIWRTNLAFRVMTPCIIFLLKMRLWIIEIHPIIKG